MDSDQFRAAMESLGLSQVEASRFLHIEDRTIRRWLKGDRNVPFAVAALLTLMLEKGISVAVLRRMMGEEEQ